MRILSWNINGIRTLPQYHPWNTYKTGDAILSALEADIICFQEMKIQRAVLDKHLAVPDKFESYISLPITKGGYSGVAVYTNLETVRALKAEEGLTGTLQPKPPLSTEERISLSYPQAHEVELFPDENEQTPSSLASLDSEGRALVLDFALFVLINVYCPAETSDNRLPYKMNFLLLLEERVRKLIHEEGRQVIVLGDINVSAAPIDYCDGHLPSVQEDFWSHPPRAWFKNWLAPSGPMVDVIRNVWPDRKGLYTCWNTKISARESNYGSRIDYILLTPGLLPWFKHGDIQPSLRGSDHCPVYIDLHDELRLESGEVLKLRDLMKFKETERRPPRISTRFWKDFSGEQKLLSTFFTKKNNGQDTITSQSILCSQRALPPADVPSQGSTIDVSPTQSAYTNNDTLGSQTNSKKPSPLSTGENSEAPPLLRKKRAEVDQTGEPKKKKQKTGQTKLSTFFAASSSAAECTGSFQGPTDSSRSADMESAFRSDEVTQIESDHKLARSLSEGSVSSAPRGSSADSKAAWTHLLAPLQPPKCKVHGEPCKEYTVNKTGPNKGKTFFLCSRPVGPGYDKGRSDRRREEVDGEYRCDFFKWASEVKKESLKGSSKGIAKPEENGNVDTHASVSHI